MPILAHPEARCAIFREGEPTEVRATDEPIRSTKTKPSVYRFLQNAEETAVIKLNQATLQGIIKELVKLETFIANA